MLSIIIPAYNVAPYIVQAVNSALDQTIKSFEVIVVDDGSTDKTYELVNNIRQKQPDLPLRIIRQKNQGLSGARNTGIRESNSEFIGFLDGDDVWLPNKAQRHLSEMLEDKSIGISFSNSEYITENGERTGNILVSDKFNPTLTDMIHRCHVGNGSSPIVRRDCFHAAGLFRQDLYSCEDYEMWCRILYMTSYKARLIPEPLTLYRLRTSSLSFNTVNFVKNADLAIHYIRQLMPEIPTNIIRAGHAEHYRIAAWKAITSGQTDEAIKLISRAFLLRPQLPFIDWRAACTAACICIPKNLRMNLIDRHKILMRRFRTV